MEKKNYELKRIIIYNKQQFAGRYLLNLYDDGSRCAERSSNIKKQKNVPNITFIFNESILLYDII